MTYEYAAYFKLLILCGYKDELQQYIDHALTEQDPLSDIILALSAPGFDDKKTLSVLNEYLRQTDSDIDWDNTVFELVMSFLKRAYEQDDMTMPQITDLMYRLAKHTDRTDVEPWNTMYLWVIYLIRRRQG